MKYIESIENFFVRYFWFAIAVVSALIYYPLLRMDPLLERDDYVLVLPLEKVYSWHEFYSYVRSPINPDLQPLRDISFMLDVLFKRATGLSIYHLHNLLLWFLCCFLVFRLAKSLTKNILAWRAWGFLFCIHPVYVMSVAWVSARKHLLAFLFLLCILNLLKSAKDSSKALSWQKMTCLISLYLCSVFSQPIAIFLPVWLTLLLLVDREYANWKDGQGKRIWIFLVFFYLCMFLALRLNWQHYVAYYAKFNVHDGKLSSMHLGNLTPAGDALLALGRYFYQFFVPVKFAVLYSRASVENIIGLILLPLFIYFSTKAVDWRKVFLAISFFILMLALVLTKIRTIFISDTYIISASLGIWFLLIAICNYYSTAFVSKFLHFRIVIFSVLFIFFFVESLSASKTWQSNESMWENSYKKEGNCFNSMLYAVILYKQDRIAEAVPVANFHILNNCKERVSRSLFYMTTFYQPNLEIKEKIQLLEVQKDFYDTRAVILAALYIKDGQFAKADKMLDHIIFNTPKFWDQLHRIELKPLLDILKTDCASNPISHRYCRFANIAVKNTE